MLRILKTGTKIAIFDVDGTLTYGELNSSPREGAVQTTQTLKNSGLEVVYLSGRHYFLTRITRKLLKDNEFAEGSLIVGQSLLDIVPIASSVGEFKASYMRYLQNLGLILDRGYGNNKSDIYAYQEVKIPNSKIFILGSHGGLQDSVALGEDFLQHLSNLLNGSQDDRLAS